MSPLDQLIHDATRGLADAPPGTRLIPLNKGFLAIVDEADFERVSALNWHTRFEGNNVRAARQTYPGGGGRKHRKGVLIYLHNFVQGVAPGFVNDHRNHIALDCRRGNLRQATYQQNAANSRP